MVHCKTKAIVIDNKPVAVNKNRVVLFTENFGKINVFLTGYGKPVNHWAGAFDAANILEISCRKQNGFYNVTGWEILHFFHDRDFDAFIMKQVMLEVTNEVLPVYEANKNIFKWLEWALKNASTTGVCVYLARLIYKGGFFNFSNEVLKKLLTGDFMRFIKDESSDNLRVMLDQEIGAIEEFTGKPVKSYEMFGKKPRTPPEIKKEKKG